MVYPSDLKEREWDLIRHYFEYKGYGHRAKYPRRLMVNGILYVVKQGVNGAVFLDIFQSGRPYTPISVASLNREFGKKCSLI